MEHSSFDERAETWEDDPRRMERTREVAAAVVAALAPMDRPTTVEIGAGTGMLARALSDQLGVTTLVDNSDQMLAVARHKLMEESLSGWCTVHHDLGRGSLPGGPYQLVISQLALHHVENVPRVLHAVFDALAPGGRVALADLDEDPEGDFHAGHDDFHGSHGFSREVFGQWLIDAGFDDVQFSQAAMVPKEVDGQEREFPVFLVTASKPI